MDSHGIIFNVLLYLAAAVISVPLAKRLGFGAVLGYLFAGISIGPWGFGFITNTQDIMHLAEFGVVLLLFLIGLELNPLRLWNMRKPILGTGGMQLTLTTLVLFCIGLALQLDWKTAFVAGFALSLSSTAIALQILREKNLLTTPTGSSGFSILLFQDIAVIPLLAVVPLLTNQAAAHADSDPIIHSLEVVIVVLAIVVGGRFLMRPVFRFIASSQAREVFTAFSLLLVIGIAALMQMVDMSMALGSFLAGVLLADSEYRHQLETDIEPFKGLLLGLFFISVGMVIDFGELIANPLLVLALVVGLIAVKVLVMVLLARLIKLPKSHQVFIAILLSQGGEFGFVIFSVANSFHIMPPAVSSLLTVVVALSMLTTQLLLIVDAKFIQPRHLRLTPQPPEEPIDEQHPVIIAGFGRFGQIVSRLLYASKIPATVIDHNPEHIERVRRFGFKVFYGDATRMDLLESAGIHNAKLLILAIDDWQGMITIANHVKQLYPQVIILARAWDMIHAFELLDADINLLERETFEGALQLGQQALQQLGFSHHRAKHLADKFRQHDTETLYKIHEVHKDERQRISRTVKAREDLEKLFEADEVEIGRDTNNDAGQVQ
ncbi:MAG: glutathione-regulated potassium-efflux system protein KefC [Gammaproteobacteria bacterium]|nr:glutathione-regulated potassium-efflux system protein KefC [Gammaproteobacteria bacterium]